MKGGAHAVKWDELYHGNDIIVCQGRKLHLDIRTPEDIKEHTNKCTDITDIIINMGQNTFS